MTLQCGRVSYSFMENPLLILQLQLHFKEGKEQTLCSLQPLLAQPLWKGRRHQRQFNNVGNQSTNYIYVMTL